MQLILTGYYDHVDNDTFYKAAFVVEIENGKLNIVKNRWGPLNGSVDIDTMLEAVKETIKQSL